MSQVQVGLVLVAFNQVEHTVACLNSLGRVREPLQIVLVDNGSRDDTASIIAERFPQVTVIALSENLGFTGGNNVGIRWCLERNCDAVLLLNNDTIVEPDFLTHLILHARKGDIVAPEVRSSRNRLQIQDELGWFDWRRGISRPLGNPPAALDGLPSRIASGCCLLIPRGVFERIGLLDERYFLYFEDVDFLVRAQLAGFRLAHEPRSVIYHHGSASAGPSGLSPMMLYYNTRNRLFLMHKFARLKPVFVIYFTITRCVYSLGYALTGRVSMLLSTVRAIRDSITGRLSRAPYWQ